MENRNGWIVGLSLVLLAAQGAAQPAQPGQESGAALPVDSRPAGQARAVGAEPSPSAPWADGTSLSIPLSKFAAGTGPLMLRDSEATRDIYFPVSSRLDVSGLALDLALVNSIALVPGRSVISVRLNEATLSQLRLDPEQPILRAAIDLPPELLRPGFNKLSLHVTQHYTDIHCENPVAPELWTEVDTSKSRLRLAGSLKTGDLSLARLADIFGPGIGGASRVVIELPDAAGADASHLQAAQLLAQGIALHRDYEPVTFGVTAFGDRASQPDDSLRFPGADRAVIGTVDELRGMVPGDALDRVTGPHLALLAAPDAPGRVMLVVTGRTAEELPLAATAVSMLDPGVADSPEMTVRDIRALDSTLPIGSRRYLSPGRRYTFADFGFRSTSLRGSDADPVQLTIQMPPDLYGVDNAAVTLDLDLAYGPAMGPGSVLNVFVNDVFHQGIHFDVDTGQRFDDYQVPIPLSMFAPGENVIRFETQMRPQEVDDECADALDRYLVATLFDTSSITLPDAGFVAGQPDLKRFVRTGFPYYKPYRGSGARVIVADPSLLGAGLTLLGKLAQVSGGLLGGIQVEVPTTSAAPVAGSVILLAPVDRLPQNLFAHVDYGLGELQRIPYRVLGGRLGAAGDAAEGAFWRTWHSVVGPEPEPASEPTQDDAPRRKTGVMAQESDLGGNAVVTAIQSPDGTAATVTVITAADAATLRSAVDAMIQPAVWRNISGDMAVWRKGEDEVTSLAVADSFQIGEGGGTLELRYAVSRSPWLWIALAAVVIILLVLVTRALLRRRYARRSARGT